MKPQVHEHQLKTNFSIVSKNVFTIVLCFSFILLLPSCKRKKLTEVVEVPLPSAEEKITIGQPDDGNGTSTTSVSFFLLHEGSNSIKEKHNTTVKTFFIGYFLFAISLIASI